MKENISMKVRIYKSIPISVAVVCKSVSYELIFFAKFIDYLGTSIVFQR